MRAFLSISLSATNPPFFRLLVTGAFAGWLIALMVWLLPVAEAGRIWVIVVLTYIVGLGKLSHVIAGSVEAIYTVAAHQHTWWEFLTRFLVPTLVGNCVGGVAMVAALNYAQVQAGSDNQH